MRVQMDKTAGALQLGQQMRAAVRARARRGTGIAGALGARARGADGPGRTERVDAGSRAARRAKSSVSAPPARRRGARGVACSGVSDGPQRGIGAGERDAQRNQSHAARLPAVLSGLHARGICAVREDHGPIGGTRPGCDDARAK